MILTLKKKQLVLLWNDWNNCEYNLNSYIIATLNNAFCKNNPIKLMIVLFWWYDRNEYMNLVNLIHQKMIDIVSNTNLNYSIV